jgi:HK97 family phage portal protein
MGLSAHFACVRIIATTLASLPFHVYERVRDGKRRADDHPVSRLLHDSPNPEMTAFSFIEAMQAQVSNTGKAFAEIVFNRRGYPEELWPLAPGTCQPRRNEKTGNLEYYFPKSGAVLPAWKILHIPGLGFDGLNSFSPVTLFRQSFGLGLAIEEYGARFFGQGTNVGGFLEHPNKLSETAYERLKVEMANKYQGLQNSHGVILLEEGMKYTKLGMSMEDIQFIESRKITAVEMARIHGVPPHLIADLEHATFSNIEEQSIEAVVYLFRPWAIRWEQAINAKLFTSEERRRYYSRYEIDGLLRGNIESRYKAYGIGLQQGFLNRDEVREKEDMNPIPDGKGKQYFVPLNLTGAEKVGGKGDERKEA